MGRTVMSRTVVPLTQTCQVQQALGLNVTSSRKVGRSCEPQAKTAAARANAATPTATTTAVVRLGARMRPRAEATVLFSGAWASKRSRYLLGCARRRSARRSPRSGAVSRQLLLLIT